MNRYELDDELKHTDKRKVIRHKTRGVPDIVSDPYLAQLDLINKNLTKIANKRTPPNYLDSKKIEYKQDLGGITYFLLSLMNIFLFIVIMELYK